MKKDFRSIDLDRFSSAILITAKCVKISFRERFGFVEECLKNGLRPQGGAFDIDEKKQFIYID